MFRRMKTVYKTVLASELPAAWREEGGFAPTDRVVVRVEPDDPELANAARLAEVMEIVGRRARARGLTEEKLAELLDER